tara:strand:+ start:1235 stop:2455 length:1221 start_codon:yes stop_codon:yes gene_type:complete
MSIKNENYLTEQSHTIEYVTIINNRDEEFDVTSNLLNMDVYEDIRQGASTLEFSIFDAHGFIIQMNLIGGEHVKISFTSMDSNRKTLPSYIKTFRIIDLTEIDDAKGLSSLLGFKCISEIVYNNSMRTISKSFKGKTASEIITDIVKVNLGVKEKLLFEPTKHKFDYVAPYIRPLEAIDYLLGQCQSSENNTGDYMFYENMDGWNLRTYESMRNKDVILNTHKLVSKPTQFSTFNFNHMRSYAITKHFSTWLDSVGGYNDIDITIVDPLTKSYHSKHYNIDDYRKGITNGNGTYTAKPSSTLPKTGIRASETYISKLFPSLKNMAQQRVSMNFDQLTADGKVVDITIPANVAIKSGDVVYLDILNNDRKINAKLSGNYVVKSLRHQVSRSVMYTHIQVVKDSEQKA